MPYSKQNFIDGQVLTAAHLNHIENGIEQLSEEKADKYFGTENAGGSLVVGEDGNVRVRHATKTTKASGELLMLQSVDSTQMSVVSKITGQNAEWENANRLVLRHSKSENLWDLCTLLGGPGTEYENEGLRAVINDDGTMTASGYGTGTSTFNNLISHAIPEEDWVLYPAGTYTVCGVLLLDVRPISAPDTFYANKEGTFTMSEPFFVKKVSASYRNNLNINETSPLVFVSGKSIPTHDSYLYTGKEYIAQFTNPVENGTFDWQSGELKDADGNLVETVAPHKILAYDGLNTMTTGIGVSTVTYQVLSNSGDDAASDFNPYQWGLPVLKLSGDTTGMTKNTAVNLTYVYGELSGTCSCKWQGSSSINYAKKNYTINFDQAFEAETGWTAQSKYCFKANYIDHSHARNLVNAVLWGQVVKSRDTVPDVFANLVNGGAVDGFPCIITLNGDFHGLYTFNIPKDGWMMGMGSGTNECILCAGNDCATTRFKAEALLTDDLEIEYITDENDTAWAVTSVNNLINACINSDGSDLDTTIAAMLDWDSVIDYYIYTVLVEGADMCTKNYLLVTFDGTKWYFSAYDMDSTFGLYWNGKQFLSAGNAPTFEWFANAHRAMELVKLYKVDAVKARYAKLRESTLSENNVSRLFTNFAGKIPAPVYMQDVKKWPMIPNTSVNNVSQIRDYYRLRVALADKWIEEL